MQSFNLRLSQSFAQKHNPTFQQSTNLKITQCQNLAISKSHNHTIQPYSDNLAVPPLLISIPLLKRSRLLLILPGSSIRKMTERRTNNNTMRTSSKVKELFTQRISAGKTGNILEVLFCQKYLKNF